MSHRQSLLALQLDTGSFSRPNGLGLLMKLNIAVLAHPTCLIIPSYNVLRPH